MELSHRKSCVIVLTVMAVMIVTCYAMALEPATPPWESVTVVLMVCEDLLVKKSVVQAGVNLARVMAVVIQFPESARVTLVGKEVGAIL